MTRSKAETRALLIDLLREYRDRLRAFKEAMSARAGAQLTRRGVQARLVVTGEGEPMLPQDAAARGLSQSRRGGRATIQGDARPYLRRQFAPAWGAQPEADVPLASFKDDLKRKKALRSVMGPESESFAGGDPALEGQQAKEDVNYRLASDDQKRCDRCVHFDAASGCERVAGLIRRVDTCDLFEPSRVVEAVRVFRDGMKKYPR